MTDDIPWRADSPCVNICVVDPETDTCIGCGRLRREIAGWLQMSQGERQEVLQALPERLATLTAGRRRKGGARAKRGERRDGLRAG